MVIDIFQIATHVSFEIDSFSILLMSNDYDVCVSVYDHKECVLSTYDFMFLCFN